MVPEEHASSNLPSPVRAAAFVPAAPDQPQVHLRLVRRRSLNQFAVAACTAVANSPGKAYNPLFLYGGVAWARRTSCTPWETTHCGRTRTATWCTCPRSRSRTT